MKKWKINSPDENTVMQFAKKCDLGSLALSVMVSRGYTDFNDLVSFFNDADLADPFIIKDMDKAADIINAAVDSYDLICVYGDYDCDGITATAILYNYLESMGANVMYYIPERSAGYGMNMDAVRELAAKGVVLIVTVDNGISAHAEAEEIAKLGVRLVITDHHQPSETLPKAAAVVNPHRRDCPSVFKELSGAGVALKLCAALDGGNYDAVMEQYSDICALGTVADIVPLVGENRTIVRQGLLYMKNTENPGLNALIDRSGAKRERLNSTAIAFQLAPRINASGRFGSPVTAVKALLSEDPDEADGYVETLMTLNEQRRSAESSIMKEILEHIDNDPQILDQRVLVLSGEGWHHGVIGIVSARLLEMFGKPNILLSVEGDTARGSARSVKGFNIFKCFTYAKDLLERFGGHECAGGLTLRTENIGAFRDTVYEYAAQPQQMPTAAVECDMRIRAQDLTIDNIRSLGALEPFGAGNPQPVFAVIGARVDKIISLSQGKHTRLELDIPGGAKLTALIFSQAPDKLGFGVGAKIDLAVNLEINEFAGRQSVNARVLDFRPSGIDQDKYFAAKDCYEKYRRGEKLPPAFLKRITPDRRQLVAVYKYINAAAEISADDLYMRINDPSVNYCKLRLCIDAFCELGLAEYSPSLQKVKILPATERVDIDSAPTLVKLRESCKEADLL